MATDPELAKLRREVKDLAHSVKQYLKIFEALNENLVEIGRRLPKGDPVTQPIPPEFRSVVLPKDVPLVIYKEGERIVVGQATVEEREGGMYVTATLDDAAPSDVLNMFKTEPREFSIGYNFDSVTALADTPLFQLDPIPFPEENPILREKSFRGEYPNVPEYLKNPPKFNPPEGFKVNIDLEEEA